MCGIAGVLDRDGQPVPLDAAAPDGRRDRAPRARRRGPVRRRSGRARPTGGWRSSTSRRPGTSRWRARTGACCITYNGEVYNFRELRGELEQLGHRLPLATPTPRSCSHAFAEWGAACVERFNGMFAFAIWDRERARAVPRPRPLRRQAALLRRASARCCCSARRSRRCSRIRALRAELSPPHLLEYFTFQNIFTDGTLFEGVKLLPPGPPPDACAPTAAARSPRRYWDFDFARARRRRRRDAEYEEELDRLFRQAVERQLVSDVPVGAHLSGGMDSGSDHRGGGRRRCRT